MGTNRRLGLLLALAVMVLSTRKRTEPLAAK
jgi:hypothetical protein